MTDQRASKIESALSKRGFVAESLALASVKPIPALIGDTRLFDDLLETYAAQGLNRVPYLITDAIAALTTDANLNAAVEAALGTDNWVMWGPNIRRATPNAAHNWHTDLESDLWPTLTVAIGLAGCNSSNGTWFLPGTHRTALPAAEPVQVIGFGNGRFFLFDAHCKHRSDPGKTANRVMLFTHFQRSDARRIPYMLDYQRDRWARGPAPYIASPSAHNVETAVARPPLSYRFGRTLYHLRRRFRASAKRSA